MTLFSPLVTEQWRQLIQRVHQQPARGAEVLAEGWAQGLAGASLPVHLEAPLARALGRWIKGSPDSAHALGVQGLVDHGVASRVLHDLFVPLSEVQDHAAQSLVLAHGGPQQVLPQAPWDLMHLPLTPLIIQLWGQLREQPGFSSWLTESPWLGWETLGRCAEQAHHSFGPTRPEAYFRFWGDQLLALNLAPPEGSTLLVHHPFPRLFVAQGGRWGASLWGTTPLHAAASRLHTGGLDALRMLADWLDLGADPNARNREGATALHAWLGADDLDNSEGMLAGVVMLLRAGADRQAVDHQYRAVWEGYGDWDPPSFNEARHALLLQAEAVVLAERLTDALAPSVVAGGARPRL